MFLRSWYTIFLILLIALLVRFLFLGSVPTAINNDQLHYILNAKSIALTGTDLSGTIHIFQVLLFRYPLNELPQAELPFFLVFPMVLLFPLTLTSIVFPNVLLSVGTVALLYLIGKKLFTEKIGVITALVAAFNPWFIFTGRTLYEVVPATFFYLCAFYVLLIAKGWRILVAFPFLLLAFYSYIGTKLIFLPFLFLVLLYTHYAVHAKKYLKEYIVLFLLSSLVVAFYLFQIAHGSSETSRLSEIITPNHPAVVERVDMVRKATIQHPYVSLFENKITIYLRLLLENLFHVFSLDYLFLKGDGFFSLERHGLFYVLDFVFVLVGAGWVFIKKRILFFLLFLLILISTIPQIIHDPQASGNFTPHIALLFPFFILFIAVGISQVLELFQRKYRVGASIMIAVIYSFLLLTFFHIYFFQLPLRTGLFDFPTRLLSKYIELEDQANEKVYVYSPETTIAFKKYLFYTNAVSNESIQNVKTQLQEGKGTYSLNNVTFLPCNDQTKIATDSGIIIHDKICNKPQESNAVGLPQLKDSGSMYLIYGDILCKKDSLDRYVERLSLSQLNVERLSQKEFCETYVLRLE